MKICATCRIKIMKASRDEVQTTEDTEVVDANIRMPLSEQLPASPSSSSSISTSSGAFIDKTNFINSLNKILPLIGVTPIYTEQFRQSGTRPNEQENYPVHTTNLHPPQNSQPAVRRELPSNLSEESILREAAIVLAQAERVKCFAEGGSDIVGGRVNEKTRGPIQRRDPPIPNKFHSLPTRKKNSKPISRSVSDASSKKPKKPSIFNIFSRKSDPNLDQIAEDQKAKDNSKRLIRSKSDAGSTKDRKAVRKRNNSENEDNVTSPTKSVQLSPIIENSQREDYFASEEHNPEASTSVAAEVITPAPEIPENDSKVNSKEPTPIKTNLKIPPGNIGYTSHEDLDLIPSKPVAEIIKGTISSLANSNNHSRSLEDMHSSQLPPEKPPLTKGVTVDGMVKRLSMERFSPPPHLSGPAFSYTRPNEQIIYAQLVTDNDSKTSPILRPVTDSHQKDMESPFRHEINGFHRRSPVNDSPTRPKHSEYPSHITNHNNNNKSEVYINKNFDTRYRSYSPQQVTRVRGPTSPIHWKQSPRNLSDEDEGLGFEPRKYFEEEIPAATPKAREVRNYTPVEFDRRRSPTEEPPIIPVIRSLSPIDVRLDVANRGRADGMDSRRRETYNEFNDLSYRRAALESKIQSRRFGSVDPFDYKTNNNEPYSRHSPDRSREYRNDFDISQEIIPRDYNRVRHLSPEPDSLHKFHKLNSNEILNKYSPERTHLDMISPGREVKTSRYVQRKYYDDGTGGVKETYQKETRVDEHGQPHVRESRRRERLDSPRRSSKDQEQEIIYVNRSDQHIEDKYRQEYEPKSFDSQFSEMNRSSPENVKRGDYTIRKTDTDHWQNSLKRDKRQQRSFDKGDSGIENDFRKESFNSELTSKWRKRTVQDDIKSCELFIRKERHHTEELHPKRKKYDFVYRERSIDDGSHFDPRLDKYPKETLKKRDTLDRYSSPNKVDTGTLKREKKKGGLEKMKQLFSGSGKKKDSKGTGGKNEPIKDPYMVREEEMRSRYSEYRGARGAALSSGETNKDNKVSDISTRRRLSTPKASPIPDRTFPQKNSKPSPSPLASKEDAGLKAEKAGWFKSLDRLSRKKSKMDSHPPPIASTEEDLSTIKVSRTYRSIAAPSPPPPPQPHAQQISQKSLRFFGDTDQESNPSLSKAASTQRARPMVMTLGRNQKHSHSAHHLDRIPKPQEAKVVNGRSNSLQNLDDGIDEVDRPRRKHHSRSRNLDDISESASDTEIHHTSRHSSAPKVPPRENRENVSPPQHKHRYYEEHHHQSHHRHQPHRSHERESRSPLRENSDAARIEFRKPPPGPPKPARSAERRQTYSRERDRLHDSSGTEGDSSLQSQRSVVYLHATTVGAIPQPPSYHLNPRRRAVSREEISSIKSKDKMQPMTRTVSRSVSMLAPWKPKHLHEGYEINYSQQAPEKPKKHSTMPRKPASGSSSKSKKTASSNNTTLRRSKNSSKDDVSSIRNSSLTSASKSGLSSQHKSSEKKSSDLRKDTLSRRRVK